MSVNNIFGNMNIDFFFLIFHSEIKKSKIINWDHWEGGCENDSI